MKNGSFLITTTSSIEGYTIEEYLGILTTHFVAGTGLFSDIAASFSDAFGGNSKSYKKQLLNIENQAISNLKDHASRRGANAYIHY